MIERILNAISADQEVQMRVILSSFFLIVVIMMIYIIYKIRKSAIWWRESKEWRSTLKNGDSVLLESCNSQREATLYKDNEDGTVDILIKANKSSLYKPYK